MKNRKDRFMSVLSGRRGEIGELVWGGRKTWSVSLFVGGGLGFAKGPEAA